MDEWMRFAADRKRQWIVFATAGLAVVAAVLALLQSHGLKTYTITDGERVVTYTTFATDPAQVLGQAGMALQGEDTFTAGGGSIQVSRAMAVKLSYYGVEHSLSTREKTVGDLLRSQGLEPGPQDRLSHSEGTALRSGMHIRIDRVVSQTQTYTATLAHEVQYCLDATLPEGTRQVLVGGVDGELLCTALVTYVNYRETRRVLLEETMTVAPVTEIVALGTGRPREKTDPDSMPMISDGLIRLPTGEVLTYYDTARVRATAYTHTDEGCDFITYTGTTVRIGTVAVDPRYIPYGTRMFIVSDDGCYIYGISVAEDCGGAIKRDRIDLYFPTYTECIQFGRRNCTIYFLG